MYLKYGELSKQWVTATTLGIMSQPYSTKKRQNLEIQAALAREPAA
jgi:hypothetical protein